jgi:hypothetical protein
VGFSTVEGPGTCRLGVQVGADAADLALADAAVGTQHPDQVVDLAGRHPVCEGPPKCDPDASSGYRQSRSRGVAIVGGVTVSVAVVASRTEAELIVGMLRSHGVSAAVPADDAGGQYPQMQIDGVRVLVAPSDEASARRLLAGVDDTPD